MRKCEKYKKKVDPKCDDQEGCYWVVGKGCKSEQNIPSSAPIIPWSTAPTFEVNVATKVVLRNKMTDEVTKTLPWVESGTIVHGMIIDGTWAHVFVPNIGEGYIKRKHLIQTDSAATALAGDTQTGPIPTALTGDTQTGPIPTALTGDTQTAFIPTALTGDALDPDEKYVHSTLDYLKNIRSISGVNVFGYMYLKKHNSLVIFMGDPHTNTQRADVMEYKTLCKSFDGDKSIQKNHFAPPISDLADALDRTPSKEHIFVSDLLFDILQMKGDSTTKVNILSETWMSRKTCYGSRMHLTPLSWEMAFLRTTNCLTYKISNEEDNLCRLIRPHYTDFRRESFWFFAAAYIDFFKGNSAENNMWVNGSIGSWKKIYLETPLWFLFNADEMFMHIKDNFDALLLCLITFGIDPKHLALFTTTKWPTGSMASYVNEYSHYYNTHESLDVCQFIDQYFFKNEFESQKVIFGFTDDHMITKVFAYGGKAVKTTRHAKQLCKIQTHSFRFLLSLVHECVQKFALTSPGRVNMRFGVVCTILIDIYTLLRLHYYMGYGNSDMKIPDQPKRNNICIVYGGEGIQTELGAFSNIGTFADGFTYGHVSAILYFFKKYVFQITGNPRLGYTSKTRNGEIAKFVTEIDESNPSDESKWDDCVQLK